MPSQYRRPGVYLEESLLINPSDVAGTTTVAAFVGLAPKGPVNAPILVESWSDFYTVFGGFDPVPPAGDLSDPNDTSKTVFKDGSGNAVPAPANLAALKSNVDFGDGSYTGSPFTAGQYVKTGDTNKQHYDDGTDAWVADAMTGTGQPLPSTVPGVSYLPFSVYTFFQNGGRFAWIVRSAGADSGAASTVDVKDSADVAFSIVALSAGLWGDKLAYRLNPVSTDGKVFSLEILQNMSSSSTPQWESMEFFNNLTMKGEIQGTKRVDAVINDSIIGSRYIRIQGVDITHETPDLMALTALAGGEDPTWPVSGDLTASCNTLSGIEGPMVVNVAAYLADASYINHPGDVLSGGGTSLIGGTFLPSSFSDREDVMSINDFCDAKRTNQPDSYAEQMKGDLAVDTSSSYTASYGPWILIPHPTQIGAVIPIPAAGAVMGVMARIDATVGYHRAPAGIVATISNAVGVQAKFTDSELGDLNASNVNIIRSVVGAGICIMGARTRKGYGPDHYISARRTLINLKEQLRRSTQYAVFENNDERLWSSLRITAEQILRPLWERGGLRGASAAQAYYIRCDSDLNSIQVISAGEVRMEIGVALQYPAEFVIIRVTQITSNQFTNEIQLV